MGDENNATADLEAAWDAVEGELEEETTIVDEVKEDLVPDDDPIVDDGEPAAEAEPAVEEDPAGEPAAEDAGEPAAEVDNAPVSWSATAREGWKDIPKATQDYIQQRESQMQVGIQKNAEMAKRAEGMDRTLQPFQQYFAMNGGAGPTINNLLQTGAGLQMGSPVQKAQLVANIIKQYGVDIASLDNLLAGEAPPQGIQQSSEVQQQIDRALAPYQQREQQMQRQHQQRVDQTNADAGNEVAAFATNPANEFYNDVAADMADILDMAANRGVDMSMADAYSRACKLNPEVDRIIQTRAAAAAVPNKRRAATSVRGNPGGVTDVAPPDSLRGVIDDAWDNAGRT